jgi:hypothetical protein
MDDVLKVFLAETSRSLDSCEGDLDRLRQAPQDAAPLAKVVELVRSVAEMSAVLGLRQLRAAAAGGLDALQQVQAGGPGAMARTLPIASDCLAEIRAAIGALGHRDPEPDHDAGAPPLRAADPAAPAVAPAGPPAAVGVLSAKPKRPKEAIIDADGPPRLDLRTHEPTVSGTAAPAAAAVGTAKAGGLPAAAPSVNIVPSLGPTLYVERELRLGDEHRGATRSWRRGFLLAIGGGLAAAAAAAAVVLSTTDMKAEAEMLVGAPEVIDTGTLAIAGRQVRLEGVHGLAGPPMQAMAAYIGGREVVCRQTESERYRCEVAGWDLSEVVLHNGGGRATATAPQDLIEAERRARTAGRGIWAAR